MFYKALLLVFLAMPMASMASDCNNYKSLFWSDFSQWNVFELETDVSHWKELAQSCHEKHPHDSGWSSIWSGQNYGKVPQNIAREADRRKNSQQKQYELAESKIKTMIADLKRKEASKVSDYDLKQLARITTTPHKYPRLLKQLHPDFLQKYKKLESLRDQEIESFKRSRAIEISNQAQAEKQKEAAHKAKVEKGLAYLNNLTSTFKQYRSGYSQLQNSSQPVEEIDTAIEALNAMLERDTEEFDINVQQGVSREISTLRVQIISAKSSIESLIYQYKQVRPKYRNKLLKQERVREKEAFSKLIPDIVQKNQAQIQKSGHAVMPFDVEHVRDYLLEIEAVTNSISLQEAEQAKTNADMQRQIFNAMLVAPLKNMGFEYDMTVKAASLKLLNKDVIMSEQEVLTGLVFITDFARQSSDTLVNLGIISQDTAELLKAQNIANESW